MKKNELDSFLRALTTREEFYKKQSNTEIEDNYHDFETYMQLNGHDVFKYTFDRHLTKALELTPHLSKHLNSLPLLIFKHNRYAYTPYHSHDFVEINYVYSGNITINIDGKEHIMQKGDLCILDTDVIHRIYGTTENNILINLLMQKDYFSTNMLSRLASNNIISEFAVRSISKIQSHNQHIIFKTKNSELLEDAISGLLVYYFDSASYSIDAINSYMIIIFSELLKSYSEETYLEYQEDEQPYIGNIIQYIENNYDWCTLTDVASHFNYNSSYLSRYLKQNTGKNFMTLVQEFRMTHASALLKNSNYTIEEISQKVGYRNLSFFYKKFNQFYSCTPQEFRTK